MKKLLFYCQHVLGMGHLMRSLAVVEGLCKEFQVTFVNGGESIPGFDFPSKIEVVNLPPLKADANFAGIQSIGGERAEELKYRRAALLQDTYESVQPDILVIELFPFGRKKFAFELIPLLARIRMNEDATKVVCSLRDIMVQRQDQFRHEDRACRIMNRYFDLLLVHSDPTFHRFEDSFTQRNLLEKPVVYTGYVAQSLKPIDRSRQQERHSLSSTEIHPSTQLSVDDRSAEKHGDFAGSPVYPSTHGKAVTPKIVASIGGGRVGFELLTTTVEASLQLMDRLPHQLQIFTGPYLPDQDYGLIQNKVEGHAHIELNRYSARFLEHMQGSDLSISMAGYNTTMNVLQTGTRAIMMPFCGGNNDEQLIRGQKLSECGRIRLIRPHDLNAGILADIIQQQLRQEPPSITLDLNGVANSVAALTQLAIDNQAAIDNPRMPVHRVSTSLANHPAILQLHTFLDGQAATYSEGQDDIQFFLRDDDIDVDEETLRQLLDIGLARNVPLNLEVIPATLSDGGYRLVADRKRFTPHLVELNQHGWQHVNHEVEGRKCEFGVSRSYSQQYDDIANGKERLEESFNDLFSPVFTPPWNRCTKETYRIVDELGFRVFSGLRNGHVADGYCFQDISVTLDIFRWKGGTTLKSPNEIIADLIRQMDRPPAERHPIGIMLHHKVMDAEAFGLLDQLLRTLNGYPQTSFHTFESLVK